MAKTYTGSISHSGSQVVKAPACKDSAKGKSAVKTGKDLRDRK